MWKKVGLELKFIFFLGLVLIGGILLSFPLLYQTQHQAAQEEVADRATILMQTMNAVRQYTSTQVNPLLRSRLETDPEFIPQTVPAYSAREIFENLRSDSEYQNFLYKEATLNPTNPRDRADVFEAKIVEQFRQDRTLETVSGFRQMNDEKTFYISRPIAIQDPSCLRCHSTPQEAPKSLIETYGSEGGFGWQLQEIVGAQTIYVPAQQIFVGHRQRFFLTVGAFGGILFLGVAVISILLKRKVIRPILPMAELARRINREGLGNNELAIPEFQHLQKSAQRTDEIGQLARLLKEMVLAINDREQTFSQQMQQLRAQNEQFKQNRQKATAVETAYLRALRKKARWIRQNANNSKN